MFVLKFTDSTRHARAQATAEIAWDDALQAVPGLPQKECVWACDLRAASQRWIRKLLGKRVLILNDVRMGGLLAFSGNDLLRSNPLILHNTSGKSLETIAC